MKPVINNNGKVFRGILLQPWTTRVSFFVVIPSYVCELEMIHPSEYDGWNMIVFYTVDEQLPSLRKVEVSKVISNPDALTNTFRVQKKIREAFKQFK